MTLPTVLRLMSLRLGSLLYKTLLGAERTVDSHTAHAQTLSPSVFLYIYIVGIGEMNFLIFFSLPSKQGNKM